MSAKIIEQEIFCFDQDDQEYSEGLEHHPQEMKSQPIKGMKAFRRNKFYEAMR